MKKIILLLVFLLLFPMALYGAGFVTITSNPFTVTVGILDHYVISTIPDQIVGAPFTVTVTAYDAYGNVKTNYTGQAVVTDLTGTITPSTITFTNGVWTGQFIVTKVQTNNTITITDQGGIVYYVNPNGDDTVNGLSPSSAWKSIARINTANLQSGNSVLF